MPVDDHPVHEKTRFKEVPLSSCHSSLPNKTRNGYWVMNLHHPPGDNPPYFKPKWIVDRSDKICKQPNNSLPECRHCTKPGERDAQRHA